MSKQPENIDKKNTTVGIIVFAIIIIIVGIYIKNRLNRVSYDAPEVERPYLGNSGARMVLAEYSDFACPACKRASVKMRNLVKKYENQLKIEYRHYPLSVIHSNSFAAAVAAECANDQEKFWEYHDKLFEVNSNDEFTDENLRKYAESIDLDLNLWQACVDSKERDKIVKNDTREARVFNFNSTPSFALNGSPVKDWTKLDKMLELELEGYLDKE